MEEKGRPVHHHTSKLTKFLMFGASTFAALRY